MLITESQLGMGRKAAFDLLNSMTYLTEAESAYAPAMVPITESKSYGVNFVKLEDLTDFAESNGIQDLGYALSLVCESSNVDPSTIAFTVQETTLLADDSMADLAADIMNEGMKIAAVPLSSNDFAMRLMNECMDYYFLTGSTAMLEAFVYNDVEAFAEAEEDKKAAEKKKLSLDYDDARKARSAAFNTYRQSDAYTQDREKRKSAIAGNEYYSGDITGMGKAGITTDNYDSALADKEKLENVEGFMNNLKKYANRGRDWLARQAATLRQWADNIEYKFQHTPEKDRGWLMKIKNKIAEMLGWIAKKIESMKSDDYAGNAARVNDLTKGRLEKYKKYYKEPAKQQQQAAPANS